VEVSRDDTHRRITIGINVRNRDVESVVADIQKVMKEKVVLPAGYYVTYGGTFENLQAAKSRLALVVPIALVLIFVLLFFTFQSFLEASIIYLAIPLSAIGGIWALWLRGMPFSVSAGIGFIALFGVAVLNGIVLCCTVVWQRSPVNICAKAQKFIWKVVCKPVNGKISKARNVTPPKSSLTKCRCWMVVAQAHHRVATWVLRHNSHNKVTGAAHQHKLLPLRVAPTQVMRRNKLHHKVVMHRRQQHSSQPITNPQWISTTTFRSDLNIKTVYHHPSKNPCGVKSHGFFLFLIPFYRIERPL
jgi:hypothetical protein